MEIERHLFCGELDARTRRQRSNSQLAKRDIQVEEQEEDWVWTERIRERQRQLELAREGYLELEDNVALVKELLTNYKINKAKIAVMDKTPELELLEKQMNYLDECVKTLDAEEQVLFREVYEKGCPCRSWQESMATAKVLFNTINIELLQNSTFYSRGKHGKNFARICTIIVQFLHERRFARVYTMIVDGSERADSPHKL